MQIQPKGKILGSQKWHPRPQTTYLLPRETSWSWSCSTLLRLASSTSGSKALRRILGRRGTVTALTAHHTFITLPLQWVLITVTCPPHSPPALFKFAPSIHSLFGLWLGLLFKSSNYLPELPTFVIMSSSPICQICAPVSSFPCVHLPKPARSETYPYYSYSATLWTIVCVCLWCSSPHSWTAHHPLPSYYILLWHKN